MADIGLSIAAKLSEYLVKPLLHHASYMFGFNKIVRNLRDQKESLKITQRSVHERMKEARRKTEIIEQVVERWVDEVSTVLQHVEKLEDKTEENKRCYHVPFQYFLAKEVASVTEKMEKLNRFKLEPFSRRTELPGMKYFSSKNFVYSKSTDYAYNKLMEALKDGKNGMIGFHGMGGSGKSTLVKEVGKKVEEMHLFGKVLMAVVSHNPQVTNIQGQIADSLDLILREETPIGRAQRLSTSLQNERTLVILDDVWEKLDLEAVGIPSCCTLLLTTRRRDVCDSMNCQITVELSLLDEEETWILFKRCADIIDDSPYALKLKNVPRKIAKKCKGLPIAIVTMASMLRGKKVEEWELALLRLEESQPIDVEEELSSCYACIKLSYDILTKQVAKSVFLLCSMFPEDCDISVEDLVRYMKGLGPAAGTTGHMEKVRREIQVAIHTLRNSYLLQPLSDQKEIVKMHDMVRDVALWIASKEGRAIKVATKTLAIVDENVNEVAAISIWGMENYPPLDQLQCPKLKTLLLHSMDDESSLQLPEVYFEGMQMLEVLGILKFHYTWRNLYTLRNLSSSLSIFTMPKSIERLTMLRSLCLRGYELGDISQLASLTRLEILDLRSSSFDELPQGIIALKKLRLLDIYTCCIKKNNPYEVIRKCTQLEELYSWRIGGDSLHTLSLPRLQKYVIVCDKFRENCRFLIDAYLEDHVPSKALCIDQFDASALIHDSSSFDDLFLKAEHLYLGHLSGGCKNIIPHMDQGGMTELIGLILESCSEIEFLVDTTNNNNLPVFSELVTLKLIWMDCMKQVFHDPSSQCSLEKLEDLQIEYCVKLTSISFPRRSNMCNLKILRLQWCPMLTSSLFIPAIARSFVLLEELKLFDCIKLRHIISEECEEDGNAADRMEVFPNLRILHVHGCEELESIFPVAFATSLKRLEKIDVSYNFGLKYVFGTHNDYKGNGNETKANINLHALRRISLVSLSNLIDIVPRYCHPRSPNLKEIECRDCPHLSTSVMCKTLTSSDSDMQQGLIATEEEEVVFSKSGEPVLALECLTIEDDSMVQGIFQLQAQEKCRLSSKLSRLHLKDLPELRHIWKGPKDLLILQKLKSLVLVGCKNLETIFSPTILGSLSELNELVVSKCDKLEQIIYSDHSEQVGNTSACSKSVHLHCPQLSIVHVFQCDNLKCLFSHSSASPFPELEFITVEECSKIEQVFYFNEGDRGGEVGEVPDENKEQLLVLPKLREVKLVNLPNLTEFCQGPYKLQQNVKHYTVRHCPAYTDSWLQTDDQKKNPISFTESQTSGKLWGMGLGSSSASASAAASVIGIDGASESTTTTSDPQIQERMSNLETNLECERQRCRLMELELKVERERITLIELKLEAEKERRRIMEDALLSFFHKILGKVPQQFAPLLSQTQLAPNEESEDVAFSDVTIQSL